MADISKNERQWKLIAELLHAVQPVSLQQLNEKVEGYKGLSNSAARRKLIRDKEELEEKGIHIELVQISNTDPVSWGYIISEADYYLKDVNLTADERAALNLTLATINLNAESAQSAIYKLGGREKPDSLPEAGLDPVDMLWLDYDRKKLPQITGAIRSRKLLDFEYISEVGKTTRREVEPWKIYFFEGHWLLEGYDRLRQAARNFRMSRIQGEIKTRQDSTPWQTSQKASLKMHPWEYPEEDEKMLRAELWVDAKNAEWAGHQIGTAAASKSAKNGGKIFNLNVNSPERLYRFVAGLLDGAEIRGEPELRDGFVKYLKELSNG